MPEAEDAIQARVRLQRAVGNFRVLRHDSEASVEADEEVLQHDVGLLDGCCTRESELSHQSVLKGTRSALHSTLGLRRQGEDHLYSQLVHRTTELCGSTGESGPGHVLEDGVPVGVEGNGYAVAP